MFRKKRRNDRIDLSCIKAGGAYVPIDPGYPNERIEYILEDTKTLVANSRSFRRKARRDNEKQ